jgi:hypothetical protein
VPISLPAHFRLKNLGLVVRTFSFPNCNNQSFAKEYDFTWAEIVGNVGTVVITGPEEASKGSSSSYFLNGTCILNPKNTFNWAVSLSQGQFVFGNVASGGGSSNSISINWTGNTCGEGAFGATGCTYCPCQTVSIGCFSMNSCSSNQAFGYTSVKVNP